MSSVAEPLEEELERELPFDQLAPELVVAEPTRERRLFYGWVMLPLATLLMVATSPGQTFGVAYFNVHFLEEFQLSKTGLSSIYLVATLLASFCIPFVGHFADKFGLRRAVLCAVTAMAIICASCSLIGGVFTMFLAFLALRVTGPGTMTLLATNTLAAWFDRRLGKVSSYAQLAMACSWAVVPMLFVWMIEQFGWRGAYLAIGGIYACLLLPLIGMLYRQSPADVGQLPDGIRHGNDPSTSGVSTAYQFSAREAMRHHSYWILVAATMLWALVGTGLIFHLTSVFEAVGTSAKESTRAVTGMAIVMGVMQLIGGILADRFATRWVLLASVSLMTASCVVFANAASYESVFAAFMIFGSSQGLMTIVANTAWARFYGRTHLGKIRGLSLTAAVAGSAIGPVIMGVSADYLGGFGPSFCLFAAALGVVTIAAYWATPPEGESPKHA